MSAVFDVARRASRRPCAAGAAVRPRHVPADPHRGRRRRAVGQRPRAGAAGVAWAQDGAFKGGSLGGAGGETIARTIQRADALGVPVVGFPHSGGARLQEGVAALTAYAAIFRAQAQATVPMISVVSGPCAGGAAYSPALGDFVVMTDERSCSSPARRSSSASRARSSRAATSAAQGARRQRRLAPRRARRRPRRRADARAADVPARPRRRRGRRCCRRPTRPATTRATYCPRATAGSTTSARSRRALLDRGGDARARAEAGRATWSSASAASRAARSA